MSDNIDQGNPSLTAEEKKTQMIEKITAAVIIIMRTANLADTSVTAVLVVMNVNNESDK